MVALQHVVVVLHNESLLRAEDRSCLAARRIRWAPRTLQPLASPGLRLRFEKVRFRSRRTAYRRPPRAASHSCCMSSCACGMVPRNDERSRPTEICFVATAAAPALVM